MQIGEEWWVKLPNEYELKKRTIEYIDLEIVLFKAFGRIGVPPVGGECFELKDIKFIKRIEE